jgi:hypothetical protein
MFNFDFGNTSFSQAPPCEGVYHVKLTGLDSYVTQSGNSRISLIATVMDGDSKGCVIRDGINLPKDESDKVKGVWMRFFSSLGLSPSDIKAAFSNTQSSEEDILGSLNKTIKGLTGYCFYAPAIEEGGWPTRKWLTPAQAKSTRRTNNGKGEDDSALGEFINV